MQRSGAGWRLYVIGLDVLVTNPSPCLYAIAPSMSPHPLSTVVTVLEPALVMIIGLQIVVPGAGLRQISFWMHNRHLCVQI
jgi:hypothetical protein